MSQNIANFELLLYDQIQVQYFLEYGNAHCKYIILEGILYADWYRPLFESAAELFGDSIFAYYYDLPFEETLKRHETKKLKRYSGRMFPWKAL